MEDKEIAITGLSAISAAGIGVEPLCEAFRTGTSHLKPVPFDILGEEGHRWGKAEFRAADFLPPLKARKYDRCSQMAVAAVSMALKDAGLLSGEVDRRRIGIVIGCGFGGIVNSEEFLRGYFASGVEGLAPVLFPNTVANAPAGNAAIEHGLKGPNVTVVQRFCSAESALMTAIRFLEEDRADIIFAGGVDELSPLVMQAFKGMGQLKGHAAGFGEGAGLLVLEKRCHAERRRAPIVGSVSSVTTVGFMLPGTEEEGVTRLLGHAAIAAPVSLSGTVRHFPVLMNRIQSPQVVEISPLIGRSLAMGGLALVAFLGLLKPAELGVHIAASPEGPFYAVELKGEGSV